MAMDAFSWSTLILFFYVTYSLGLGGLKLTMEGLSSTWYKNLKKARWQPPSFVFQIWNLLYACIALAGWFAVRKNLYGAWYYHASLSFWIVQLLANAAWSPVFFGLREPLLALGILVLTLLFAGLTMGVFFVYVAVSGYLFIPYVLWLIFAFTLNLYIVVSNEYAGSDARRVPVE